MSNCTIKATSAENLDFSINCENAPVLSNADFSENFQIPENPELPDGAPPTETVEAPPSANVDIKTGGFIGIALSVLSLPIVSDLLKGVPFGEAFKVISDNFYLLVIVFCVWLLRETITGVMKQWTFGKSIDSKADPNKTSVEIKPS